MTNKQKQLQLKHLGYYCGKIDGSMGPTSREATRNFQSAYGLVADASFGPLTEAKSIEVWTDIQNKLNNKGFNCGEANGYVGDNTINAIYEFQRANGLVVDGSMGPASLAKLNEDTKPLSWDDFPNFRREEFRCPCGKCNGYPYEPDLRLVKVLQEMRDHYNTPINITSGVRCQNFNDSLPGSVKNSPHLYGKAADFIVVGVAKSDFLAYSQKLVREGKIAYTYTNESNMKNAVHINL